METDERIQTEALKRNYQNEHHLTTMTVSVVVFLCVVLAIGFLAMSTVFDGASGQESVAQAKYPLPCVGAEDYPVSPSDVSIRVLNGSELSGYATAISKSLEIRGFSVTGVDSAETTNDTQIWFGANAIDQAYTLADHFDSVTLVLDNRKDGLIDVVIGRSFMNLKDIDLVRVTDVSIALPSPSKCIALADIKPQIAITHDETLVPAYKSQDELNAEVGQIPETDPNLIDGTTPPEVLPDIAPTE